VRILYLANNYVGAEIISWLKERNENIVGLVVHPEITQKFREKIIFHAGLPTDRIFYADSLEDPTILDKIRNLKPDIGVSIFFGYILKKKFLDIFPKGCINLHPAYLPYNRGAYPNVWSIIDGTPAGSTLHYLNEGVDSGDIISRKEVTIDITDTGKTLYHKLEAVSIALFKESWSQLILGTIMPQPQKNEDGSYHKVADVEKIDFVDPDHQYRAIDLINIIRARTFPPYKGAYIVHDGEKIYLRIQLFKDNELTMRDSQ
jgi:methionyl-tRNA formyltransferase